MESIKHFSLPQHLQQKLHQAKKLEWITFFYLLSVIVIMYLTLGSSQAMKSAWLEDLLSLVPSVAFLISTKINDKSANQEFPYGYHRVFSISFLAGAVALLGMGLFLVYDSSMSLIKAEHPTIGSKVIFGQQVWMGWVMMIALLYSSIPAMILGFKKLPLSEELHNKVLYTDASAQKADYMTAFAAILGIGLVGIGLWWADSVAALFISFSVLKDGITRVKTAALDLMDRYPKNVKNDSEDELIGEIARNVRSWPWVQDAKVRFRESGQVYFGQIAVVPKGDIKLKDIEAGYETVKKIHWKIYDFTIDPVSELP
ncbi:cation diffusion facilitator family transporter [Salinimicrobium soli]|uniref:cation diffusion facilitator family transporter n=1 Tax=Salinimicrobium soli TaxID=1254399 RepID=UPI003AAF1AF0